MSTYPPIAAGQTVTAGLLRSMLPVEVLKPGNTDRVNNTMSNDPDLTATLEANAVYEIEFKIQASGLLAADFRTLWTVPTGATGLKNVLGPGSTANEANADNISVRLGVHGFGTIINYSGVRDSIASQFPVREWCNNLVTTNAGTLALNWAQVTTNATATRVAGGSMLKYRRIG